MRLLVLKIEDFRSIHDQWLPADGLVVLFGPNSAGKTSVLEAAVELLRVASSSRVDPAARGDVFAIGTIRFSLPHSDIGGSSDAELFRALLTGEYAGGHAWEWLAPDASDFLRGKTTDDAREWIVSRLVEAGQVGLQDDREILAKGVLDPAAIFFVADFQGVIMYADASRISSSAIEAACRIAATTDQDGPLLDMAVSLTTEQVAAVGWVADFDQFTDMFPPVIVLDGDPESLSADLRTAIPIIHDRFWNLHYARMPDGGQLVDDFEIGDYRDSPDYYRVDTWLEQMSDSGKPEIRGAIRCVWSGGRLVPGPPQRSCYSRE